MSHIVNDFFYEETESNHNLKHIGQLYGNLVILSVDSVYQKTESIWLSGSKNGPLKKWETDYCVKNKLII